MSVGGALPPAVFVSVDVSFDVDNDRLDEFSTQNTHSIEMGDTQMIRFYRQVTNSGDVLDRCYDATGMVTWLRSIGVIRGSKQQRIALIRTAILTLFDLCDQGNPTVVE